MTPRPLSKQVEILLVEDSPADVLITREALSEVRLVCTIHVARDGAEATEFLHKAGRFTAAPQPDLILLDLNMPRKNGRELLAEIKTDPRLMAIPVVVLTTSAAEEDILKAYNLHANCYVVKPLDFTGFAEAVQSIRHFWFSTVALPMRSQP